MANSFGRFDAKTAALNRDCVHAMTHCPLFFCSTVKKTLIVGGTLIVILAIIAAIIVVYSTGDDKPYREPSILGVFDKVLSLTFYFILN